MQLWVISMDVSTVGTTQVEVGGSYLQRKGFPRR